MIVKCGHGTGQLETVDAGGAMMSLVMVYLMVYCALGIWSPISYLLTRVALFVLRISCAPARRSLATAAPLRLQATAVLCG